MAPAGCRDLGLHGLRRGEVLQLDWCGTVVECVLLSGEETSRLCKSGSGSVVKLTIHHTQQKREQKFTFCTDPWLQGSRLARPASRGHTPTRLVRGIGGTVFYCLRRRENKSIVEFWCRDGNKNGKSIVITRSCSSCNIKLGFASVIN